MAHKVLKVGFHQQRSQSQNPKQSQKSTYGLVKIKNQSESCKQSHKGDRIGVGRIRTVPFSYDSVVCDLEKTRLSEPEAEAEG